MSCVTLDRVIHWRSLDGIECQWLEFDRESPEYADKDGVWQVLARCHDGRRWIANFDDEGEARQFASRAGGFFGVPVKGGGNPS